MGVWVLYKPVLDHDPYLPDYKHLADSEEMMESQKNENDQFSHI